jgi:predicted metalloprotease
VHGVHRILLIWLSAALALAGCDTVDDAKQRASGFADEAEALKERGKQLEKDARRMTKTLRKRIEQALDDLEKAVPEATTTTQIPARRGREIEAYLTEVIEDVDQYWTRTLTASGRAEPRVSYQFVAPGQRLRTACDVAADDDAAFYCTGDDTIYLAQGFAERLARGVSGDAVGDFGVAFVVAHEYAHNIQNELGFFESGIDQGVKPFELQADCMAGLWANSVYQDGRIKEGDVEEAMSTAELVGDFEFSSKQHHGTPDERREAWVRGYRSGDPSKCNLQQ